jgi:endoglucanase
MSRFTFFSCLTLLFFCFGTNASTLVEIRALTNRTLVVHFDDGYVRHHQMGETRANEWVVGTPLDTEAASLIGTYAILSANDLNYATAAAPTVVYRKSKPTDFTWLCQGWNGSCVNTDPDHTKEHWFYLELPYAMENGKSYQVSLPGLAEFAGASFLVQFDDQTQHTEAVHTNLNGYAPDAGEKFGYVYHWLGDGGGLSFTNYQNATFSLISTVTEEAIFTGNIAFRKPFDNTEFAYPYQAPPHGNLVGVEVYDCDFSTFNTPGSYRLCVAGMGCSFPFDINDSVYFAPTAAVMTGLLQQRSGIELTDAFTNQPRPAPHNPGLTPGFGDKMVYSTVRFPDFSSPDGSEADKQAIDSAVLGPLEAWGWYQDAGDWDSYYAHTDVPAMLLWLYEMTSTKYGNNQFALPEANNGVPDLLDEAMWLPRFHYRLRNELIAKNYGTGGVGGGRVFGDLWGGDENEDGTTRGSWLDTTRTWVCTGEDPFMTFKYAGLAAHIAFLLDSLEITDSDGIDWQSEAIAAYTWAANHMEPQDSFLFGFPMLHLKVFAAGSLFRLTGTPSYQQDLIAAWTQVPQYDIATSELLFGLASYKKAASLHTTDSATLAQINDRLISEADFVLTYNRNDRACRWGGNYFFPLVIGQGTTPLITAGILGHHLFKDELPDLAAGYKKGIYSTADYFLGNNPLNMTWISGFGERNPTEIFCLDGWYLPGDSCRQGIVPYGFTHTAGWGGNNGPWSHYWPFEFTYPASADAWPGHERWFDQRTCPATNEYTIYQTLSPSILTYGYLYGLTAPDFVSPAADKPDALAFDFTLFPNPTDAFLAIKIAEKGIYTVSIHTFDGKLVLEQPFNDQPISIAKLPAGLYSLHLSNQKGKKAQQTFVKR